ncbi:hypothetical protein BU23DRAFT_221242 [Bimuria novae-zelandiae CBS 107.79]|uniref:CorA-like transporter domain-containing protein n=1 Tax=Bimuria novae-zelandiae CBS 107.79 TaxID=1447943 RepID=A0A6A5VKS8_9PLEO|nr:hypothetical protein BU23DRAFT_221242 [Bimuria novae-zelandiae CBS 107.79]
MERLHQSCHAFERYPDNLRDLDIPPSQIANYKQRLEEQEKNKLFVREGQASVEFLSWGPVGDAPQVLFTGLAKSLTELQASLRRTMHLRGKKEPHLIHIFIYAKTSRNALQISLDMLTYLFTYHRVAPAFLEFLYSTVYRTREENHDAYFSGVEEAHQLALPRLSQAFPELGRSGRLLKLSYNLRSAEKKPPELGLREYEFAWSIETMAVYHSFDIETGHALWLTCESNAKVRGYIKEIISSPVEFDLQSNRARFMATLATHVLVCDWTVQNWRWYLKALEDEIESIALGTRTFDLGGRGTFQNINAVRMDKKHSWSLLPVRRVGTTHSSGIAGLERIEVHSTSQIPSRPMFWSAKRNPSQPQPTPPSVPPPQTPPPKTTKEDEELLAFKDMQQIDLLEDQAREALLVLNLNIEVLEELQSQYKLVMGNAAFPEDLGNCESIEVLRFFKRMKNIQTRYQQLVGRAEKILVQLNHRKNSTFFLIQYRNMRQSRQSAIEMESMTKNMERVANRTQQEAISMRIITLVTLFFLPATSIATIFSSGIIIFKENDTWTAGKQSVLLYLAVCIPLTVGTFLVWWFMTKGVARLKKWIPTFLLPNA